MHCALVAFVWPENSSHVIPSQLRLMYMERRRFSQIMASEWQSAFVISHKMPLCALLTAVKNYNKSLEKLQDFFFKTETKIKTKRSRPRPRPRLQYQDQDFHFCPLVSRSTSLVSKMH